MTDAADLSPREARRRATRAAIEEHATGLVAEHGMDNVTVEEICGAAGISKRTFFNYVDSKETAVLGDPPRLPDEGERSAFLAQRHENLLLAVLDFSVDITLAGHLADSDRRAQILGRRREIRNRHPELILQRSASFHEIHHVLREMLEEYFTRYPDTTATDSSPAHEASVIVTLAGNTLQVGYMSWLHGDDDSPIALNAACRRALDDITALTTTHNGTTAHGGDVP